MQKIKMIWKHSPTSQFNVKTAYHAKIAKLKRKNEESSHGSEGDKYWKILWKLNVPGFVKYFLWKACYDILPTKLNLYKKICASKPSLSYMQLRG